MVFFSWKTSDTNKSISNVYSNKGALGVYLLTPCGGVIEEQNYEGYGVFGGQDVYTLLAMWNKPEILEPSKLVGDAELDFEEEERLRRIGIELAFSKEPVKFNIRIVERDNLRYFDVSNSDDCPEQGYFYKDEYMYDEDESMYDEDGLLFDQ